MADNSLTVKLNGKIAGLLTKDSNGGSSFEYDENAKNILSLSLPLQNKKFSNEQCHGFFNGLLPESYNTRVAIGKKYGVNHKNDFALLKEIGYDCAGAVSFFNATDNVDLPEYFDIKGERLSSIELKKYIQELPKKPLALASEGIRLSLAGAQDKTCVILIDDEIALPDKFVPTTHILKPAISNYKETVENEYICMKSAQKLGLKAPNVEIREVMGLKYFLIERYDRFIDGNKITRIHQEDFCQASNIVSAYKYQADGGIDFEGCVKVLDKTTSPALSKNRFIELLIFNYLIGNNDAHGKNFSILHHKSGNIEFAPAYDVMCSMVYPELSKKMAMKIGGYYERNRISKRHFEQLAQALDVKFSLFETIINQQCEMLPNIIENVISSFENTIGASILKIVKNNCKTTLRMLEM